MRFETVLFGGKEEFARLTKVLVASAEANSPKTPIHVNRVQDMLPELTKMGNRRFNFNYPENVWKTIVHTQLVHQSEDGEIVCLLDCDLMVLKDLSECARFTSDLTLTAWPTTRPNTGVYFVKVSPVMRKWMTIWTNQAVNFLKNKEEHKHYRWLYGGINQAALGWMLERVGSQGVPLIDLRIEPNCIWNCTPNELSEFSADTKVVHLTSYLREMCFGRWPLDDIEPAEQPFSNYIVDQWRKYDSA